MTHQGTTITDLVALVFDLTKELEPWEIMAHARMHLANSPMTRGDEIAWELMAGIQARLIAAGRPFCEIRGDNWDCGHAAVTFCRDCGLEICEDHSRMVAVEVYCESCAEWAEAKIRAMIAEDGESHV